MHFAFKELNLYPGNFADALKGMRLIHLCDLHITRKSELGYLHQLIIKINEHKPDLVFFTGDIINDFAPKVKRQLDALKGLDAPAYFVSGNQDALFGLHALKRELALINISCLDNACAHLIFNNTPLQVVGLSDTALKLRRDKRPLKALFSSLDESISTILLSHQAKDVERIENFRIDIQLSAPTHNADAYAFHALLKKYQPYYKGLYTKGKTLLYVSSGLNRSRLQLKRKFQSEIAILTIN